MILLGGVTRLTNSGLSMVEWKPLMGIIPPLNHADWQELFFKYKQFPEYQKINAGMSLDAFKSIFMYEYLHRVLGRFIGIIFVLPFLYFYFTKRIKPGLTPKLLIMLLLGGGQGLLGWYMVKSGLVDNPRRQSISPDSSPGQCGFNLRLYLVDGSGIALHAQASAGWTEQVCLQPEWPDFLNDSLRRTGCRHQCWACLFHLATDGRQLHSRWTL